MIRMEKTDVMVLIDHQSDEFHELMESKKNGLVNELDKIHFMAKSEGYDEMIQEAKVSLNKHEGTIAECMIMLTSLYFEKEKEFSKERLEIPFSDEQQNTEEEIKKRGILDGKMAALTDIRVITNEVNAKLAKDVAVKAGKA